MLKRMDEIIEQPVDAGDADAALHGEAVGSSNGTETHRSFLYLPHNMPHIPLFASERFKKRSAGGHTAMWSKSWIGAWERSWQRSSGWVSTTAPSSSSPATTARGTRFTGTAPRAQGWTYEGRPRAGHRALAGHVSRGGCPTNRWRRSTSFDADGR